MIDSRSIEEIREEFEAANTKVETEFEIISSLVKEFSDIFTDIGENIQVSRE